MSREESRRIYSRPVRRAVRFARRAWQVVVVAAVALAVAVAAFLNPGLVQADVQLDEGNVFVAKQSPGVVGVLNAQIDEIAAASTVGDSTFAVLQYESQVLVHGRESSTLIPYDSGRNVTGSPVQLPANATVQLVNETLLVVSTANGRVWYGPPQTVLGFDFQKQEAALNVGEFGVATLTTNGEVLGLDVQRSVLMRLDANGQVTETSLPFEVDAVAGSVSISAVGDRAVVLDRVTGVIWVEDMPRSFSVSGASTAVLARPAPDALGGEDDLRAIYATRAGLIGVTPDGTTSLSGQLDGEPVEPVQVAGCVYGAFGETFVKRCAGSEPETELIPQVPEGAELAFQINRATVALNDVRSGVIWMVNKDMLRIEDWAQVIPPEEDEESDEQVLTETPPDRDAENQDPVADDDELSARAGRSTVLPVLDNDTDPDGDILTISAPSELAGAALQAVRGGAGLQVTIGSETTGTIKFEYSVIDGRGGSDTATVTLTVLPADQASKNSAPYRNDLLAQPVEIRLDQTITQQVLLDWRDPDGDSLILEDAWLPADSEDELTFTTDGLLVFDDIGKTTGPKQVNVRVSDGVASTEGQLDIEVGEDVVKPIAYGDYATVPVSETVTVQPLANDVGAQLALTEVSVENDCGCTIDSNYREGWFTFSANKPGTYYATYRVSNGPVTQGLVRIDVRAETEEQAPVAALDVALLPPGGEVLLEPLANDTDADGDVLVIQNVSSDPGLDLLLQRRNTLTISADHLPDEPVTLSYRVSDGKHSVLGTIVVIPTPITGSVQPTAENDEVRVRAGASQTVAVLENDDSPVGLDLTLDEIVENPLGEQAWIDGDQVRISIPSGTRSSSLTLAYQVSDAEGRVTSASIRVTVVSEDAQNEAPVPQAVVERVLSGTTTRLRVPLEGVDPNGDTVRLVGLGSGPRLGRVLATGDGWLTYEAYPDSQGTDVFSYQVIDSLGAVSDGEVRVGVAPPGPENAPPSGGLDELTVAPGSPVQLPVLANDYDVDGDAITFANDDPVIFDEIADIVVQDNQDLVFTAPTEVGSYVGAYQIIDARGEPGSGELVINVEPEAENLAPQTRDDMVSVAAVVDQDWVEVAVLDNDYDPDGYRDELSISVPEYGVAAENAARTSDDGRSVVVPVTNQMQQIRYVITDPEGKYATGLILVPGRDDSVPVVRDPELMLEAVSGEPMTFEIDDLIVGTYGRSVRLSSVDSLSVTKGSAVPASGSIEFTSDDEYVGPASVVFEVADEVPEGDESGKSAYVTIPINVIAPANASGNTDPSEVTQLPPRLTVSSPVLKVGQGEGESQLNLVPLFVDPEGDDFYFRDFAAISGNEDIAFRTSTDGDLLFAQAPLSAPVGSTRTVKAIVEDGSGGTTEFEITIQVVSSTKPKPIAVDDEVDDAAAGESVKVAVLENDKSFLLRDTSLSLVSASVISGDGSARVEGDQVVVNPAADLVGTMTVRYTIVDATNDPDRQVDGMVRLTVNDRPGRPGAPQELEPNNGSVTFKFTDGEDNGSPITKRWAIPITADGDELAERECRSTTCTVTGLTNGQGYRFKVVVANAIGRSDPSPESALATPDIKPETPAAPTTEFGDSKLSVSWQAPVSEGSPITGYVLKLESNDGASLGSVSLDANQTSHTWTGLTNGTRYRFRVAAENRAGISEYSDPSDVNWPTGKAKAPGWVQATPTATELGGAFSITFPANINANGGSIEHFVIEAINTANEVVKSARIEPTGADELSVEIEGLGETPYKFRVYAVTRAGNGQAATSEYQTAWALPVITRFTATVGSGFIQLDVRSNLDDDPESDAVVQYNIGDGWVNLPQNQRITGLTNGRTYEVRVRVVANDKYSNTKTKSGLTPKSNQPNWPYWAGNSIKLVSLEPNRVEVELAGFNLLATEGWRPADFSLDCSADGGATCSNLGDGKFAVAWGELGQVDEGYTDARIDMSVAGYEDSTSDLISLSDPVVASWDPNTGEFRARLRYVNSGTCKLIVGGSEVQETQITNGGLSWVTSVPGNNRPDEVTMRCYFNNSWHEMQVEVER